MIIIYVYISPDVNMEDARLVCKKGIIGRLAVTGFKPNERGEPENPTKVFFCRLLLTSLLNLFPHASWVITSCQSLSVFDYITPLPRPAFFVAWREH